MKKSKSMPKTVESSKPLTPDEIAELADSGEDISRFFIGNGKMMPPIVRAEPNFAALYMKSDILDK